MRVRGGREVDSFHRLVRNARPLSIVTVEITGLSEDDLLDGEDLDLALADFLEWLGDDPCVAHNGLGYDYIVLDAACARLGRPPPTGERLDSLELAHVVHPRAGEGIINDVFDRPAPRSRRLEELAAAHQVEIPTVRHRAVEDVRLLWTVTQKMLQALASDEPSAVLARWILHQGGHPWAALVESPPDRPSLVSVLPSHDDVEPVAASGIFDPVTAVAPLAAGGSLIGDGRSVRSSQVRMAAAVAEAFAEQQRKIIEAPTGTGKTFAYLVPAVEWARASGTTVAIATHSKVLQDQVLAECHALSSAVGPFTVAVLKGMDNYISVEQLEDVLDSPPDDPTSALVLSVIVRWAACTPTGDWSDLRIWSIEARTTEVIRWRWRLSLEERIDPWHDLSDRCLYERSLTRAGLSHVVVLNHAVAVSRQDWFEPEHTCLVVDESHNLEESATGALTERAGEVEARQLLSYLYDPARRWGTLGRWMDATGTGSGADSVQALLQARRHALRATAALGEAVVEHVRTYSGVRVADMEQYGTSYRIREWEAASARFLPVRSAAMDVVAALRTVADLIGDLPIPDRLRGRYRRRALEAELSRIGRQLRELARLTYEIANATDPDAWIAVADLRKVPDGYRWSLRRVPLSVSGTLQDLWAQLRAVVLTSATLQVGGSFGHVVDRLGLADASPPLALETPFTALAENQLLVIPDHLPTPTGSLLADFAEAQAEEVGRLILLTRGRTLALYTARSRMQRAHEHLAAFLDQHGLPLLCQGTDPAPALVERMRADLSASLVATRSFWEGVDVPGAALSSLIIEKLPFASIGDPVHEARMEMLQAQGRDPFAEYLVPDAVIRFAQGVGRLIRTRTDRGVVVVMDKRLRRPVSYRDAFLASLPGPPRIYLPDAADDGYQAVATHLDLPWDQATKALLGEVPTTDQWAFLTDLQIPDQMATDPDHVLAALDAVREHLGFSEWRQGQVEVMTALIAGSDVLGILPTGSGKSITYQVPALLRPGLTLVVSPLIALMRDQVRALKGRGVRQVAALHSGQSQAESDDIISAARAGSLRLLYLAPERLWNPKFTSALRGAPIRRVAVDEAHCVSQWGHTFRPEYGAIPAAIERLVEGMAERPSIAALTATATPEVQAEISELLKLQPGHGVNLSPDRPELFYAVLDAGSVRDRDAEVLRVAESLRGQSMIVYVPRQKDTVRLAGLLRTANHRAAAYHGGMEPEERVHVEESFVYDEVTVVVATKAFGLGIDKPDVAAIVHIEMPASVEEYIQETGRGARGAADGVGPSRAWCVLIRAPRDCGIHRIFVKGAAPDLAVVQQVWEQILDSDGFVVPEDLVEDGEDWGALESVNLAVSYLQRIGSLVRGDDLAWSGRVHIPHDAEVQLGAVGDNPELFRLGSQIIDCGRALGTEDYYAPTWARASGLDLEVLDDTLWELHRRGVVGVVAFQFALRLRQTRTAPKWDTLGAELSQRRESVKRLSQQAKTFRAVRDQCRRSWLRWYMGDEDAEGFCDACDVCRPDVVPPWTSVELDLDALNRSVPATFTILAAVKDLQQYTYGMTTVSMVLHGKESSYHPHLNHHPLFGALSALTREQLDDAIEDCLSRGLLDEQELVHAESNSSRRALFLTDEGRRML